MSRCTIPIPQIWLDYVEELAHQKNTSKSAIIEVFLLTSITVYARQAEWIKTNQMLEVQVCEGLKTQSVELIKRESGIINITLTDCPTREIWEAELRKTINLKRGNNVVLVTFYINDKIYEFLKVQKKILKLPISILIANALQIYTSLEILRYDPELDKKVYKILEKIKDTRVNVYLANSKVVVGTSLISDEKKTEIENFNKITPLAETRGKTTPTTTKGGY